MLPERSRNKRLAKDVLAKIPLKVQWPVSVAARTARAGHTARKLGVGAGVRTSAPAPGISGSRRRVPAGSLRVIR